MTVPPERPRRGRYERAVGISERAYRALLRAYPRGLRDGYGEEMARLFRDLCREELNEGGGLGLAALWVRTLTELLYTTLKERGAMLTTNARRSIIGIALATAAVLLVPLVANWPWTLGDFVFAGALIFGTGLAYVLVAGRAGNRSYRAAVGVALAAAFLLIWINLAVGIIGEPDEPANAMYLGVLAVGAVGVVVARLRPRGMGRALFAMALAQALVTVVALVLGLGSGGPPAVLKILMLNGFFLALFAGAALLFRRAARWQAPAGTSPES